MKRSGNVTNDLGVRPGESDSTKAIGLAVLVLAIAVVVILVLVGRAA